MPPTVGRIVHYNASGTQEDYDAGLSPGRPYAAMVTCVHFENMVNVTVFNANGQPHPRCSVYVRPEPAEGCDREPRTAYWPKREGEQLAAAVALQPMKLEPMIGEPVHYQAYGTPGGEYLPAPRAATITQVNEDGTVGLAVLNPTGLFFNSSVPFSAEPKPGYWNWMR